MTAIKNFFFLYKKDGTSQAEFESYWTRPHAKLAQKVDPAIHSNIVQNVYLEPEGAGRYGSGLVETWHPDAATVERLYAEPVFQELLADEVNFLNPGTTQVVATEEEVVLDRGQVPSAGKLIVLFRAAEGADRGTAIDAFRGKVRRAALEIPDLVGYVESVRVGAGGRDLGRQVDSRLCDAVAELYFADDARRERASESAEFARFNDTATGFARPSLLPVVEVRRR